MAIISWLLGLLGPDNVRRPAQRFDFLALPGEIRNQIYLLTLPTDPAVLDAQHKSDCSWSAWEPHERQSFMEVYGTRRLPCCNCWTRHRLAILLANRQIHYEAAPFFWAKNHFSFRGIETFIDLVGTALRPQYQQMIPHITIYSRPENPPVPAITFRAVLFQCKGLRTLGFPCYQWFLPEYPGIELLATEAVSWARLTSELPNLKMLSLSFFTRCSEPEPGHDRSLPCRFVYRARISKCLDLTIWFPKLFKPYRPLNREDIHFGFDLRERAFPRGPQHTVQGDELVSTGRPDEYRCAAAVVRGQNTLDVTHPEATPMTWIVKRFIVPKKAPKLDPRT